MSQEPIPNDPTDDELESLAQDLFGVSLNEQQDVEPFDVGEFDLDEIELETVSAVDEDSSTEQQPETVSPLVDDDFGASLLDSEEEPEAPPAKQRSEPIAVPEETVAGGDLIDSSDHDADTEKVPVEQKTGEAEDDYWDALDGFDWNEGGEASQPKSSIPKELVDSSDTFEDLSIESAEKTDEYLDDADFGAGLDEQDESLTEAETSTVDSVEESNGDAERKSGRRRGRRRRKRRRDQEQAKRGESAESAPAAMQEQQVRDEDQSDDGFGAGLEIDEPDQEQPAKRRRRRGGSRRGRRRTAEQSIGDNRSAEESLTSSERDEPKVSEKDSAVNRPKEGKYRSVPTWEEAIGYLVRAKPVKGDNGDSSGGNSRRGGRRGSGRRRRK